MRMCCCRQLTGPLSCTTSCCSQKNLPPYSELQLAVLLPPKVLELLLKSGYFLQITHSKKNSFHSPKMIIIQGGLTENSAMCFRDAMIILAQLYNHTWKWLFTTTMWPASHWAAPGGHHAQGHLNGGKRETSAVFYFTANSYPAGSRDCFVLFATADCSCSFEIVIQIHNKAVCIRTISEKSIPLNRFLGH